MAASLEANATTVKPSELTLECPFLTRSGYDSENNRYFCDYEPWAYGLFAIACLLLIMVPLVLTICCVVRNRHKRKFERRLRSTLSNNTSYSSSEVPYQPLTRDRRKNYGATENGGASTSRFFPNEESVSETPSQQQDNASTTSSKASLYPNFDQTSLDHRNASAFHTAPRNSELAKSQNSKSDTGPYASTTLVTDSVSPLTDVPSNAIKSPIYAVLEEPSPKEPLLGNTEEERTPSELLRSPEVIIIPENNHENVESCEQLPYDTDEEKKPKNESLDDLYTLPEVSYAPNKELNSTLHEEVPSTTDSESRDSSPVYNVLEQPLPKGPEVEKKSETNLSTPLEEVPRLTNSETRESSPVYDILEPPLPDVPEVEKIPETGVKSLVDDNISRDSNSDHTKPSAECTDTPESIYTPLVPPKERSSGDGTEDGAGSGIYQPLTPKRRERFTSRTDYEEFLLEMIKSLPEEQRNGAFVVRDSVTNPGSKALTVYNKSQTSGKEVFNFKVCFDDKGQVFLAKSTKRFPSLEQLLQYLRTNKDMLPCILTSQVN